MHTVLPRHCNQRPPSPLVSTWCHERSSASLTLPPPSPYLSHWTLFHAHAPSFTRSLPSPMTDRPSFPLLVVLLAPVSLSSSPSLLPTHYHLPPFQNSLPLPFISLSSSHFALQFLLSHSLPSLCLPLAPIPPPNALPSPLNSHFDPPFPYFPERHPDRTPLPLAAPPEPLPLPLLPSFTHRPHSSFPPGPLRHTPPNPRPGVTLAILISTIARLLNNWRVCS